MSDDSAPSRGRGRDGGHVLRHMTSLNWRNAESQQASPRQQFLQAIDSSASGSSSPSGGRVLRHVRSMNWRNRELQPDPSEDQRARSPSTHPTGRVIRHVASMNWRNAESQPTASQDRHPRSPSTRPSGRVLRHVASMNWRNAENQQAASEDQASQTGGLPESSSSTGLAQGLGQDEEVKSTQVQQPQGQVSSERIPSPLPIVRSVQSPDGASGAASGTDTPLSTRLLTHHQSFLLTEPTAQSPVSPTDFPSAQPPAHPDTSGLHEGDPVQPEPSGLHDDSGNERPYGLQEFYEVRYEDLEFHEEQFDDQALNDFRSRHPRTFDESESDASPDRSLRSRRRGARGAKPTRESDSETRLNVIIEGEGQQQQGQASSEQTQSQSSTVGSLQSPDGDSGAASGTNTTFPLRFLTRSRSFLLTDPTAQPRFPSAQPPASLDPSELHEHNPVQPDPSELRDVNDTLFHLAFPPNTREEIAQDDARQNDIHRDIHNQDSTPSFPPFQHQLDQVEDLRRLFAHSTSKLLIFFLPFSFISCLFFLRCHSDD